MSIRPDRPVSSIMSWPVATIDHDATLQEAAEALAADDIGALVVLREGGLAGIISERDVVRGLAERGPRILDMQVSELMTRDVVSCAPRDTVKQVMAEMTRRRIRHLPVIAEGVLCGIVSIGDVVKNRLDEMETETNVLREVYIART